MPTKTKAAVKAVKATASKTVAKVKSAVKKTGSEVKPAAKKAVAKSKRATKTVVKKVSAKARAGRRKATGFIQHVKDGIHTAMESVGDFVKKVTPDALLPESAKSKR